MLTLKAYVEKQHDELGIEAIAAVTMAAVYDYILNYNPFRNKVC